MLSSSGCGIIGVAWILHAASALEVPDMIHVMVTPLAVHGRVKIA